MASPRLDRAEGPGGRRGLAWRATLLLGLLLIGGTAISPPGSGAQGFLSAARMEVTLPALAGPVPVVLEYRLLPDTGTVSVDLSLLAPEGTVLSEVRLTGPGGEGPLRLRELRPHYWTGSIPLPPEGTSPSVRIRYTVDGGWSEKGRITLPIPAVTWSPLDPHPGTFVATVAVPEGITVTESFPTSVTRRPDGSEGGPYEMALQSIPSILVLRIVPGEAPFLGLERTLDILVVLALMGMGAAGVRYLKGGEG